jgi:hypothetical protein
MHLADLVAARRDTAARVGWCAIFTKAYGLVAAARPELRRCYVPFPWPRLYEHPLTVASVALERNYRGEPAVFFAQVVSPERMSLAELDRKVREYKQAPLESVGAFRRALRVSRLPRPLRRFAWWLGLNASGYWHARYFGTVGVSLTASLGAASLHQLSPLTVALNYSPFRADGTIDVRLTYDHRVLDGGPLARALAALEDVLHAEILTELRAPADRRAA